jgi:hypothetical protein
VAGVWKLVKYLIILVLTWLAGMLLLGLLALTWQLLLSGGILFVIYVAVSSNYDPDRAWATTISWVQPVQQMLQSVLSWWYKFAVGSDGSSSQRPEQAYGQQQQQQQQWQQQQPAAEDSSSNGRCSYVGVEYRDGETLYTVHLHLRKGIQCLSFKAPDRVSSAQMEEAMECAVDEFNATDTPAVRKLAKTAQFAKVEKLVNGHMFRIVQRDHMSGASNGANNGQQQQQQQ